MTRFWISWEQLTSDFRPLQDPPQPENICAWWCSGGLEAPFTLCAIVEAKNEDEAEKFVKTAWQTKGKLEVGTIRFIEEREADWLPSDRFPITKEWEKQRLNIN